MSTRSYICMEVGDDQYKTIYCHFDGYLKYNGAMLQNHYSEREQVEKLLELGNMSILREKLEPDPNRPHSFEYDEQQNDVCVFYGRDRGDKNTQAKIFTLKELDDLGNWTDYVYIFTKEGEWKYFETGEAQKGLRDVKEDLARLQEEPVIKEPTM